MPIPASFSPKSIEARLNVGEQSIICRRDVRHISMTQWPYIFEPSYLAQYGHIVRTVQGRGNTHFITWGDYHWVLRHYYRGGVIGRVNRDLYVNTSIERTRAYREWALLLYIEHLNLPSVRPVAIRVVRGALFHYADILTQALTDVQPLHDYLTQQSLPEQAWAKIGALIAQFHAHGIYHADLNAHNILLERVTHAPYLIDFDKGAVKLQSSAWQQGNLQRLHRSLEKECRAHEGYAFTSAEWSALCDGYRDGEHAHHR